MILDAAIVCILLSMVHYAVLVDFLMPMAFYAVLGRRYFCWGWGCILFLLGT